MIKGSTILFSRITNNQRFSDDCLKDIIKANKNKQFKIAKGTCIIDNFRYYKGNVLIDFTFPNLVINTSGKILSKINIPNEIHGIVTKFLIDKIELIQKEKI